MHEATARNLRTAERFLLAPPLAAKFGSASVAICDISARGARFQHDKPLETGMKSLLQLAVDGRPSPLTLEAVVVWSQPDGGSTSKFVSGARTYGPPEVVSSLIAQLQTSKRTNRIEELRSTDRFFVTPALPAIFDGQPVHIEDLSARGARIELPGEPKIGATGLLQFSVPQSEISIKVPAQVQWSAVKALNGGLVSSFRAGLNINEKPELMRLAIGLLCELVRATLDTHSLRLKLKIMRARARQLAPQYAKLLESGVPVEQYLLIQGVREELRLNPEEAMHYYRRARLIINDPATREIAPPIAHHPDALAVWEYLDRSVDPTIVGRAFELPLA
jgi:hypothetical protein